MPKRSTRKARRNNKRAIVPVFQQTVRDSSHSLIAGTQTINYTYSAMYFDLDANRVLVPMDVEIRFAPVYPTAQYVVYVQIQVYDPTSLIAYPATPVVLLSSTNPTTVRARFPSGALGHRTAGSTSNLFALVFNNTYTGAIALSWQITNRAKIMRDNLA